MFHQNACRHQTNKCQVQKIWGCLHASLPLCLNCFYSCLLSSALKELAMRWIDISTASVLWPEYQHACGNFKMLKIPELSFTLMICTRKKFIIEPDANCYCTNEDKQDYSRRCDCWTHEHFARSKFERLFKGKSGTPLAKTWKTDWTLDCIIKPTERPCFRLMSRFRHNGYGGRATRVSLDRYWA